MSCVVGIVGEKCVIMGADTAMTMGNYISTATYEKIFVKGPFVYGVCGLVRQSQVLRYAFSEPPRSVDQSVEEYIVGPYSMALVDCLRETDLIKSGAADSDENYKYTGVTFALAYDGGLYAVTEDLATFPVVNYIALGSGGEYAMGALHALEDVDMDLKDKVLKALEAASAHSPYVKPPFHIATINRDGIVEGE